MNSACLVRHKTTPHIRVVAQNHRMRVVARTLWRGPVAISLVGSTAVSQMVEKQGQACSYGESTRPSRRACASTQSRVS